MDKLKKILESFSIELTGGQLKDLKTFLIKLEMRAYDEGYEDAARECATAAARLKKTKS